jgi:hypothetical protein
LSALFCLSFLAILFWLFRSGFLVLDVLFYFGYLFLAVLSFLFCPGSLILAACGASPILAALSWPFRLGSPVMPISLCLSLSAYQFWLSCSDSPLLSVLFWLSCPGGFILETCSSSCSAFPVLPVQLCRFSSTFLVLPV